MSRVIITGAAGGIGTAATAELRRRGATVVGLDLSGSDIDCDVRSQASVGVKTLSIALLTTLALGLTAASASAADIQTCRSDSTVSTAPGYKRVGREVRKAIRPEVQRYLGAQYTALWLQPDDDGWYVGVAPGKRSLSEVRAWLRTRIARHFRGSEATLIASRMHVISQPYGAKRLIKAGNEAWEILVKEGSAVNWDGGDNCTLTDAYRVEITLYEDSTARDLSEYRQLLEPLGDIVRVQRVAERFAQLPVLGPLGDIVRVQRVDYPMSDDVGR